MSLNILLVDDSQTVRTVIAKTLELSGVDVGELYEAPNGKEALEILSQNWVDLVFADINMPVMGGIEMVNQMCEDGLLKTVPVVIVSTEGSSTRIDDLKSKGIRAYVRKPFTPEDIKAVIDEIVEVGHAD